MNAVVSWISDKQLSVLRDRNRLRHHILSEFLFTYFVNKLSIQRERSYTFAFTVTYNQVVKPVDGKSKRTHLLSGAGSLHANVI